MMSNYAIDNNGIVYRVINERQIKSNNLKRVDRIEALDLMLGYYYDRAVCATKHVLTTDLRHE